MAVSHVELYEALKGPVGEKAARMIADVVPPAAEVARRLDVAETGFAMRQAVADVRQELAETRLELADTRAELRHEIAEVRVKVAKVEIQIAAVGGRIDGSTTRTIKWILGVTVPLWVGTWAMMAAILLRAQ